MRASRTTISSFAAISVALMTWGAEAAATSAPSEPATSGFSVAGALADLPADLLDDASMITMADLDAVTAAAGLTTPESATDDDYVTWVSTITGYSSPEGGDVAPAVAIPPEQLVTYAAMADELEAAVGFDLADVAWFADVSALPDSFSVYAGSFDDSTLPDTLAPVTDGIVTLGEGEDFAQRLDEPTPLSQIGMPQRIAVSDGQIAVSPNTTLVENWLAGTSAATDDDDDDDDLAPVAAALDEAGAISAVIGSLGDLDDVVGQQATPEQREAILEQLGDAALDDVFDDHVGIGWTAVDGQPTITIVYSLDDDADPAAAVDSVRRVFDEGALFTTGAAVSDYLTVDDVVAGDGVVVATVHPGPEGRPITPFQMLVQSDLPFATID